jgi:hypothetical protein
MQRGVGGVYTHRGTAPWLRGVDLLLTSYFERVLPSLASDESTLLDQLPDLRSILARQQTHSLTLPEFDINYSHAFATLSGFFQTMAEDTKIQCLNTFTWDA